MSQSIRITMKATAQKNINTMANSSAQRRLMEIVFTQDDRNNGRVAHTEPKIGTITSPAPPSTSFPDLITKKKSPANAASKSRTSNLPGRQGAPLTR